MSSIETNETALTRFLAEQQWRSAGAVTRSALLSSRFDARCIADLDAEWSSFSDGRFGFTAQIRAAGSPPARAGSADWDYAIRLGKLVGWHNGRQWCHWHASDLSTLPGPVIAPKGAPEAFPPGCFPFHDAVVDAPWPTNFSPRDCWGEHVWDEWCKVWRTISQ